MMSVIFLYTNGHYSWLLMVHQVKQQSPLKSSLKTQMGYTSASSTNGDNKLMSVNIFAFISESRLIYFSKSQVQTIIEHMIADQESRQSISI